MQKQGSSWIRWSTTRRKSRHGAKLLSDIASLSETLQQNPMNTPELKTCSAFHVAPALQKYLGSTSGETGFSDLVKQRLNTELECLQTPQAKVCSLVVDEMRIKQRLEYHKQRDVFLGDVDVSKDFDHLLFASDKGELANSLLCFLLCGSHAKFKVPVGYFLRKAARASCSQKLSDMS
ncbi:hypothetical protein HPB48_010397 [Haemaphysalis longicornis]|uniref:Transposable element P transposase-like RNase H domain-containing protein n=1 Tax=Haemaphysalis longicornis TaxID=44386 RepID=A0A9J6GN25_HAELO|nr:hypothetical protein HPB48_010397 [Haemaphysalis longicornis]